PLWLALHPRSQRRILVHPTEIYAPPCREVSIAPSAMSRAVKLQSQMPEAADIMEKIAGGIAVEGVESLAPVLVDEMLPLMGELPAGSLSVVVEPEKIRARAHDETDLDIDTLTMNAREPRGY
ncbi:hypothetical protein QBC39DRAFT_174815, partial [Podospora conica]